MRHLTTMRYLLPIVLAACSADGVTSNSPASRAANASASFSSSSAVEHSFSGSGIQAIAPGYSYGAGGAVHTDGNGHVWGRINVHIYDLSLFGISGTGEIQEEPTCMRVVGNEAWIGLVITKSTESYAPVGGRAVIWMRDGGPGQPDVGHEGPADFFDPNNMICSETPPPMPADPVTSGNFIVR